MIFDAGSGIIPLGKALLEEGVTEIDLFFSHVHYDHIIGLPYFLPAFWNKAKLRIWAGHMQDGSTPEQLVDGIFRPPYFPITKEYMRADVEYRKFSPGDVLKPSPGVRIVTGALNHPNGAVGYRIERDGATFCYLTDFEHDGGAGDAEILRLAQNADLALLDATYTPEEYPRYVKFGHSTWEQCGALCAEAGVRRVGHVPPHAYARRQRPAGDRRCGPEGLSERVRRASGAAFRAVWAAAAEPEVAPLRIRLGWVSSG